MMSARGRARLASGFVRRFEFDRRVVDLESLGQPQLDLRLISAQRARWASSTTTWRFQRAMLLVQLPQVKVVDFDDALDRLQLGDELVRHRRRPGAFHENVNRAAHHGEALPEDESGDHQRDERVDPSNAEQKDRRAGNDHADRAERVAQVVQVGRAKIQVSARHGEQQRGRGDVDDQCDGGYGDDDPAVDLLRLENRAIAS